TLITGDGRWDGIGTALIGVLLVIVAGILGVEMNSLLIGESATVEQVAAIERALVGGSVQRVIHMKTMHLGPEELLVAAKIAVGPQERATDVAEAIDAAERRVRAAVPIARMIYLEPDVDRHGS
ncbi:MAG TPA: cation transporter, partial [Kineosporiaceae bacterium]|nr:cation transporter [Kineosporiaceae bacterium]